MEHSIQAASCTLVLHLMLFSTVCFGFPTIYLQNPEVYVGGSVELLCSETDPQYGPFRHVNWVLSDQVGLLSALSADNKNFTFAAIRYPGNHGVYRLFYTTNGNLTTFHLLITNVTVDDGNLEIRCRYFYNSMYPKPSFYTSNATQLTVLEQPSSLRPVSASTFASSTLTTMRATTPPGQTTTMSTAQTTASDATGTSEKTVIAKTLGSTVAFTSIAQTTASDATDASEKNVKSVIIGGIIGGIIGVGAGFLVTLVIGLVYFRYNCKKSEVCVNSDNQVTKDLCDEDFTGYEEPLPAESDLSTTNPTSQPSESAYMPYVKPVSGTEGNNVDSVYMELKEPTGNQPTYETHINGV